MEFDTRRSSRHQSALLPQQSRNLAQYHHLSLIVGLKDAQAAVGRTDRLNWLCSAWSQEQCLPTMRGVWKRNERAVHRAAAILDVIEVPVPANAVRNINTPSDLDTPDGSTIDQ